MKLYVILLRIHLDLVKIHYDFNYLPTYHYLW